MYKAIIVDDEDAVRFGLRDHFDWQLHGVEVTATFPDCAEAYEYICLNPVDLVVTDVITPYMDGITFAKKLQKEHPTVKIVFISGHADVKLLREAMKSEAIDYILKSVDLDELSATITRVVKLLDSRSKMKEHMQAMEGQLQELIPLHRERVLQSLLEDDGDLACAPYLGLKLDSQTQYICMVCRLTNAWKISKAFTGSERLALSIDCDRICAEAIIDKPGSFSFKNQRSEFVILIKCESADYEQDVLETSERIRKALKDQLDLDSAFGISEPTHPSEFSSAYEEACDALEQRYYLTEGSVIAVTKYSEIQDTKTARELAEKQMPNAILSGDTAQVEAVLNQVLAYKRTMPEVEKDNFMLFLLLLPARTISSLRTQQDSPYQNQRQLVEHWLSCPSQAEQEQFLRQIMKETTLLLQETSDSGTSAIIRQVKAIIDEQYMEQISVASLAAQVHLTPTYLCVLFKQATGKTVNEYLTSERIRHAKRLLSDPNVRLYDICYKVGYLSPSYFSKLFKKQTGIPPGEYRAKAISEESGKENG